MTEYVDDEAASMLTRWIRLWRAKRSQCVRMRPSLFGLIIFR